MANCPPPMSGGQCETFSHDFNATGSGGEPVDVRYNLWYGPGTIDSMTGLWSGTDLEPGFYDIAVNARNVATGVYSITCWSSVDVLNQSPAFPSSTWMAAATVGELATVDLNVTNDCDSVTFTLVDNSGVEGAVTLNASTGELNYTPTANDSSRAEPVAMLVSASDNFAADTITVVWRFTPGCFGTVGNVDCDPGESVDIGDLTTLIDNLFITFTPLCLPEEANCDGDPGVSIDIGDLTALIDNLFITFTPLPACS